MPKSKKDFTLRAKKLAKTKIALANEFMDRMKKTRFSDISIKEVCEKVEISEGTFYNYFPHKIDLVCYFNKFTILKLAWEIKNTKEKLDYVEMIEYAFDALADDTQNPFLFYEIISLYASERIRPDKREDLTVAEKVFGLPDCPGIEKISILSLEDLFTQPLKGAQKDRQLSANVPVDDIVLSLMSTAIGIPLAIDMNDFGKLKKLYRAQLSLLWKGLSIKRRK
jgi:AcrR family transcriptional regulator